MIKANGKVKKRDAKSTPMMYCYTSRKASDPTYGIPQIPMWWEVIAYRFVCSPFNHSFGTAGNRQVTAIKWPPPYKKCRLQGKIIHCLAYKFPL